MTRQSRIYEDPVDSSLRNIGVIPVYDPPLEEMQRRRKRAGRRWPEGVGGDDDLGHVPTGIGIESLSVPELTLGAVVGDVSVDDPDPGDSHRLFVDDTRFEFSENTLKLKDDQQLLFADAAIVRVRVTALDSKGNSLSVNFDLEVQQSTNLAPTDIDLSALSFNEQSPGANIAVVTVTDPNPFDAHTFVVSDIRFEIVDLVLRLKVGEEVVFAEEQTVTLTIQAIDPGLLSVTIPFELTVIEGIFPDPNNPPTEIQLSAQSIADSVFGYVIGTVVVQDIDLPNDTMHLTVDDDRFVIIGDQLRLKPTERISFLAEPVVVVTITARDSGGEEVEQEFNLTVFPAEEPDIGNAVFVSPVGAGSNSGSNFANAMPFASLNTAITQAAAAGKQVLLASHLGNYTAAIVNISSGGADAENRVKVWGCNAAGDAADAVIVGTRTDPWVFGGTTGSRVFTLQAGAAHLHFRNIVFQRCGDGCFRFADNVTDVFIENCHAVNVRRFIENLISGVAVTATWAGGVVRNCSARGYSRSFARLQYDTNNILFENCFGDSELQRGDNFPVGIPLNMTVHDIVMNDCEMRNHWGPVAPGEYLNGDGFSTETGNFGIVRNRCRATGNIDGGFDDKGDVQNIDCWSADNKKNYRIWRTESLLRCVSADPNHHENVEFREAHISFHMTGIQPHGTITDCAIVDSDEGDETDVFQSTSITEPGGTATIVNTSLQKASTTVLTDNGPLEYTGLGGLITPPANTVAPVITGTGIAGEPLEVTTGTWDIDVTPFYQWLRNGAYIDDALGAIYIPVTADIGTVISCRVFGKSATGYLGTVTVAFAGTIAPNQPVNTVLPTISGIRVVGGILTASEGTWTGEPAPTFTYQWTRSGANISGATSASYTLVTADATHLIRVVVTGTNIAAAVPATSDPTAAIGAAGSQTEFYVRPSAAGTQDGASWANAIGGLASLNGILAAAAPAAALGLDPVVYIRADESIYSQSAALGLTQSGSPGHHITVRGVDEALAPAKAEIQGGRTVWTQPGVGTLTNPFTTTNGSPIVTVTHVAHDRLLAGPVNFDNATAVGGITISGRYTVTEVTGVDTYTITHTANASSGATGGGSVAYDYEVVTDVSNWTDGVGIFTLGSSGNYLTFEHLNFVRCGDGCFRLSGAAHDLTIQDIDFFNIKRFFEMSSGQAGNTNITIQNIAGTGFSESVVRCRGFANNWLLKNINVNSARQEGDNFAIGIDGSEDSFDITLEQVIVRNCHDEVSAYWNGDGFKNEGANDGWTFTECEAYGCTDGGFDLKGINITMTDCIAGSNKKNYRLWGDVVATTCTSIEPIKRGGTSGSVHFNGPTWFRSHVVLDAPILINGAASGAVRFNVDAGSQFFVKNADISGSLAGSNSIDVGATFIEFDVGDVTPPTVLLPHNVNVDHNVAFSRQLAASEPVMWKMTGGADFDLFLRDYTTLSMEAKDFGVPVDADTNNVYVVTVTAMDAGENSVQATFNVTVLAPRWTPATLGAQLSAWWKAEDLPDATVTSWTDFVTGKTLTASGAPVKSSTSFNSAHPGVTFDGNDLFASTSLISLPRGATAGEMWAIADATGAGANVRLICAYGGTSGATNRSIGRAADHAARVGDGGTTLTDGSHLDFTGLAIIGAYWEGTTEGGRRDGRDFEPSATATIATLATGNSGRIRIGANNANTAATHWVGVIRHVIITTTLSAADRERMEGFLAWDSGLEGLLPVSHTYKSAAP